MEGESPCVLHCVSNCVLILKSGELREHTRGARGKTTSRVINKAQVVVVIVCTKVRQRITQQQHTMSVLTLNSKQTHSLSVLTTFQPGDFPPLFAVTFRHRSPP